VLSAEISTIYKHAGRVRKVHHLVYVPELEKARALNAKLAQIDNLGSDGHPILGLDSRHLLTVSGARFKALPTSFTPTGTPWKSSL